MFRRRLLAPTLIVFLSGVPCPAPACSLCGGLLQQAPTWRQEAVQASARLILFGTLVNPRSSTNTELAIDAVLRPDPALNGKKLIDLGRYLPISDPKNPPRFLVFCDVNDDKLDPYRGVPITGADSLDYIKKALALDPKDPGGNLDFYFRYLENPDKEVAHDAFLEFARANDLQIGNASSKLSAEKLRAWITDPQTPPERVSLYAFLLGGCGGDADADFLAAQLNGDGERTVSSYDGCMGGYIHLRPRDGWDKATAVLRDSRKPLPMRLAVVRTVRMYHGWRPQENHDAILKCLTAMIAQGELADIAVEDLRKWKWWDLTPDILAVYGMPGFDAPIMKRAIVRYALTCKDDPSNQFVAERRRAEPELVKEVEESLQFEK
ncbi:MAG TPA: hypothetical protein VMS17_20855 [Gemmataceae bacterium]|nr:hypothetical protein [Gemmataceae bacterium]